MRAVAPQICSNKLSLELQPNRELYFARRTRPYRGDWRDDRCVQVHRVDDAAKAVRVRWIERGLRLSDLRVIEDVVELRAEF